MNSTVPKLRNYSKHISDIDSKIIPVLNEKKKRQISISELNTAEP